MFCSFEEKDCEHLWLRGKWSAPCAGQSTYFIRNASLSTRIYAIDPEEKPMCNQGGRWIDQMGVHSLVSFDIFTM